MGKEWEIEWRDLLPAKEIWALPHGNGKAMKEISGGKPCRLVAILQGWSSKR